MADNGDSEMLQLPGDNKVAWCLVARLVQHQIIIGQFASYMSAESSPSDSHTVVEVRRLPPAREADSCSCCEQLQLQRLEASSKAQLTS
jgi:hypothetical protein